MALVGLASLAKPLTTNNTTIITTITIIITIIITTTIITTIIFIIITMSFWSPMTPLPGLSKGQNFPPFLKAFCHGLLTLATDSTNHKINCTK